MQKWLNRSRCRLGADSYRSKKHVLDGGKIGQTQSPPRGMTIRRGGHLSNYFGHMLKDTFGFTCSYVCFCILHYTDIKLSCVYLLTMIFHKESRIDYLQLLETSGFLLVTYLQTSSLRNSFIISHCE